MNRTRWPALAPALCIILGVAAAPRLPVVEAGPFVALAALGLALGRRWSRLLGLTTLATLHGALVWVLPDRSAASPDPERSATLTARLVEPWSPSRYGGSVVAWRARARVVRLRQGGWVAHMPRSVILVVGGEEPPPTGWVLRLHGHLRRSPGYANRGPPEPGPWRLVVKSRRLVETTERDRLGELSAALRRRVEAPLVAVADRGRTARSRPGLSLLTALVLGDRTDLEDSWRVGLRRYGLSHLLAVSGLHVALLLAPILLTSRRLGRGAQLLLAVFVLGLYALLVGPRPSLLRAAAMAMLFLATRVVRRPSEPLNSLALAAAALTGMTPEVIHDLGFQLTVAATAGILVLVPWWNGARQTPPGALGRSLQISLAAQVATLPWVLSRFAVTSPIAPLMNLLAVPWTGVCLLASVAVALAVQLVPALAPCALDLLDVLAAPFGWPSRIEPSSLLGSTGVFVLVPVPVAVLAAAVAAGALRWPRSAAALAGALVLWWVTARSAERSPHRAELVLLDVGQGDALLLRDDRAAILVDGGGAAAGNLAFDALLPALSSSGIRALDVGVLSHPDRDHCQGLLDLSRLVPIGELWVPDDGTPRGLCAAELLERFAGRARRLRAGDTPSAGGWRFEVLHPSEPSVGRDNLQSLVLRGSWGGIGVLLTGDITARVERELARSHGSALRSQILKVPHHGSQTSSSLYFLDTVRPRLALVSAGVGNPYGHPNPKVLARYRRSATVLLRSDRHGKATVSWSAGGPLAIRTNGR